MPPLGFDPATVLAHDRYLRALARTLVGDQGQAEDLAQQAWVAALERRPVGPSLHAWLQGTLRRLAARLVRSDARRLARERRAARLEAVPSHEQLCERERLRRDVASSVMRLEEPYCTTVALRFFEGLPPRVIARRMGVPVETVRTRVKRGLERLREALDREHGDRRSWCLAFAPLARPEPLSWSVAGITFFTGAFVVTTKVKLAITALCCVALSLVIWKGIAPDSSVAPGVGSMGSAAAASGPSASLPPSVVTRSETARVAIPPASRTATGSLLVHLTWKADHAPASDVFVRVYRFRDVQARLADWGARTAALGDARVSDLPPGKVYVQVDRCPGGVEQIVAIEAGRETRLAIELSTATDVQGLVVDTQDAPIAGAEIWITDRTRVSQGAASARSAADGTFFLRGLDRDLWIEARAASHAPSALYQVQGRRGKVEPIRLVLPALGGALVGLVRGPDGMPVIDAIVEIGAYDLRVLALEGGRSGRPAAALDVRSDARGAFRASGLAAGKQKVTARAPGFAPFVGEAEVIVVGESSLTIDLVPGVTLEGTITGRDGKPAERARVTVGDRTMLDGTGEYTRADGGYLLEDLAPGEIEVVADGDPGWQGGDRGKARVRLMGRSGDRLRWDACLEAGLELVGRVIDERGQPVPGALVKGAINAPDGYSKSTKTDADGRFRLVGCKDAPTEVDVRLTEREVFPRAKVLDARPGPDELLITLRDNLRPSVSFTGIVLGADGQPISGAFAGALNLEIHLSRMAKANPESGAFRLGPYPPGWWSVGIIAPGHASLHLPYRALAANETWDLGTVTLETPGFVQIEAKDVAGKPLAQASCTLRTESHDFPSFFDITNDAGRSEGLARGKYELLVHADGCVDASFPVTVENGKVSRLSITLSPGLSQTIKLRTAPGDTTRVVRAVVRDSEGRTVLDQVFWGTRGEWTWNLGLAPGSYRLEASTPNGRRGSAAFEAKSGAAEIGIELR